MTEIVELYPDDPLDGEPTIRIEASGGHHFWLSPKRAEQLACDLLAACERLRPTERLDDGERSI